ncbi:MAG: HAMP domain-containing protein [Alphaproteobacteria bacterium]|nr:HAMP domain-containing protein [Alphaproteobacteria bacterium]
MNGKLKIWPRTLAVQLIAVTAAAVVISNFAVAWWFEQGNERQKETALNERVLDRAAAVAATLIAIPPSARGAVMRSMNSPHLWQFTELRPGDEITRPMSEEGQRLAQRLSASLPPQARVGRATVLVHEPLSEIPAYLLPAHSYDNNDAMRLVIPLDAKNSISMVFLRSKPTWPIEMIVAATVATLVTSAGAALVARRVVRPLSDLTAAASLVARGGSAPRVAENGPDDVRNAAIAFNHMTEKVTRTLESQRHLLSAVGHDLRTPITAMRINLEFVEEEELRERLQQNLDELQALTEQVLAAARGAGAEGKRNVDLSALVESLCADLDDLGEPVTYQTHSPAPVSCRPNEIRRAVRNLVENAVAYGARADVQIATSGDGYDIVIEDEGPGIPEDEHIRVFEPFVRLESSRNAATGGTGLGLTLAKAIAEGHGGAIMLENRRNGGLRARMHLPRMVVPA